MIAGLRERFGPFNLLRECGSNAAAVRSCTRRSTSTMTWLLAHPVAAGEARHPICKESLVSRSDPGARLKHALEVGQVPRRLPVHHGHRQRTEHTHDARGRRLHVFREPRSSTVWLDGVGDDRREVTEPPVEDYPPRRVVAGHRESALGDAPERLPTLDLELRARTDGLSLCEAGGPDIGVPLGSLRTSLTKAKTSSGGQAIEMLRLIFTAHLLADAGAGEPAAVLGEERHRGGGCGELRHHVGERGRRLAVHLLADGRLDPVPGAVQVLRDHA